jgi:hypothetical protein
LLVPNKNIYEYDLLCTHCFLCLTDTVAAGAVADTAAAAGDQQVLLRPAVLD